MRIIHLAGYSAPYPGSFVPMLRAVAEEVGRRGWSFAAFFPAAAAEREWYTELVSDGLPVGTSPPSGRRKSTTWLAGVLDEQPQSDTILHTHFTTFDSPASANALRNDSVRVFWHLHTPLHEGAGPTLRNRIKFATAGRRVEAMLCVSEDIRRAAGRRGAPSERLILFPNAIDLKRFPPATNEERVSARAALSLPSGTPVLTHFGWDWERKGGDLFLATVDALVRDGLDVQALCVGGGEPAREAVSALDLNGRVRVVESKEDVRAFYLAADVFVSPSRAEGMPYSVIEALCTGTPVVASDLPGHALIAARTPRCRLADWSAQAFAREVRASLDTAAADIDASVNDEFTRSVDVRSWAERLVHLYAPSA
jgi:glycosyltransferase involved in cell wall biosynthesis